MSRSKKDILDTEAMLQRLTALLADHLSPAYDPPHAEAGQRPRWDAESLRRISMTLHRWHELECGDSDAYSSWTIARGKLTRERIKTEQGLNVRRDTFEHDDNGKPYLERHYYTATIQGPGNSATYSPISDREAGARKRLAAILARYPTLTAYVQGDPRGCALYILKQGDLWEGMDVSSCYSRGLAVFQ